MEQRRAGLRWLGNCRGGSARAAGRRARPVRRVDLERVHQPVGLLEGGGVVGDVVLARAADGGTAAGAPDLAGPVTAEGDVEHDLLWLEVGVDVTAAAAEASRRGAPAGWVGVGSVDIGRDAAAREEPDADRLAGPFGCVDAATVAVEARAVGLAGRQVDTAASVVGLARGVHVTVAGGEFS